jgi:alcohol dehydrogenase class IV
MRRNLESMAIDAFTHLIEGYLNANSTYISDIYGEKALN